jgi:UDP-N-acetylmuramoyl-tripeptide--D-alanyl-D-alanine ligase
MCTLDHILKWAREEKTDIHGAGEVPVHGFSIDTRTLQAGDVFIALPGTRCDGHAFIEEALRRGASGVLVSRAWFASAAIRPDLLARHFFIGVDDTLNGLQSLARWYRSLFNGPLVGITGSNGKTTTKEMLASILGRRGPVLKSEGNLNNHIGLPLSLLRLDLSDRAAVVEMGISRPGEMGPLCDMANPTVGVITNIGRAHLEFLVDLKGVAMEKQVLFDAIGPNGAVVINRDDLHLAQWEGQARERWTYAIENDADLTATDIEHHANGTTFTLQLNRHDGGGGGKQKIVLNLLGRHQVYNAMAASAAALALGYEFHEIREGLRLVHSPVMRGEVIEVEGASVYLDAYNANPESNRIALQVLADFWSTERRAPVTVAWSGEERRKEKREFRKVAVLGDMLELGEAAKGAHLELGRRVAQHRVDRLIAVGRWSLSIAEGAKEGGMATEAISAYEALSQIDLRNEIHKGDVVLIKGSRGMKMERALDVFRQPG